MSRRLTIDLSDTAEQEVQRLCERTGLTTPDLFRNAMSIMRKIVEAEVAGRCVIIVSEESVRNRVIKQYENLTYD